MVSLVVSFISVVALNEFELNQSQIRYQFFCIEMRYLARLVQRYLDLPEQYEWIFDGRK